MLAASALMRSPPVQDRSASRPRWNYIIIHGQPACSTTVINLLLGFL